MTTKLNTIMTKSTIHIDGEYIHIHTSFKDMDKIPNVRGKLVMLCKDSPYAFGSMRYDLANKITLYVREE